MRIRRPWPCGLSFSDGSSGHSMVFARQCVTSIVLFFVPVLQMRKLVCIKLVQLQHRFRMLSVCPGACGRCGLEHGCVR